MMLGLIDVLYFNYLFSPAVTLPGGQSIVNIGLLEQKRSMANGGIVLFGGGSALLHLWRCQGEPISLKGEKHPHAIRAA